MNLTITNLKKTFPIQITLFYLLVSCLLITPLFGLKNISIDENKPVLYYADSQTYDRELGILILKGHVEFNYEGTTLEADYVTYNEQADLITASGHVRMREAEGDIYWGEYMELTGDMKEGILLGLRALLEDDSKLAALESRKFEDREEFDQAVYTPCKLCGDKPPTWQLNAKRAIKDEVSNDIHFTDAQLRILDTPLFYLPYATQPLERRTGFLIPQPRYSSDLGFITEVPYYIALSRDKDLTLTPAYLANQGPYLSGNYRQAFGNGFYKLEGSITKYTQSIQAKKAAAALLYTIPNYRGHAFGKGAFNLTDIWRVKGEGGWVSDKTYFRKYGVQRWQSSPTLMSKGVLEGFINPRDYASATALYFQGLRTTDNQDYIPIALPLVDYQAYSDVDPLGGRFTFDGNLLNLSRSKGTYMQRAIGDIGWQRPWTLPIGQVFTVFGSTRGDLYNVTNSPPLLTTQSKLNVTNSSPLVIPPKKGGARFFPQAGANWAWPFVTNTWKKQSIIVQPIGQLIGAPAQEIGIAANRIPNIDSIDFTFNDLNLFSADRYPGYDLIDTGSRAVYGGQVLTTGKLLGDVGLFLGQNYSFARKNNAIDTIQGLRNGFSDYIGRLEASPWKDLTVNYRFRLEEKSFSPLVSEVGGAIGPSIAKLSGTYVLINKKARLVAQRNFDQINLTFSSQFTKTLTFTAMLLQDLNPKKGEDGALSRGIGLTYRDDCFTFGVSIQRQYFVARDLKPETLLLVSIGFKNIGDFSLPYNPDQDLFEGRAVGKNATTSTP